MSGQSSLIVRMLKLVEVKACFLIQKKKKVKFSFYYLYLIVISIKAYIRKTHAKLSFYIRYRKTDHCIRVEFLKLKKKARRS